MGLGPQGDLGLGHLAVVSADSARAPSAQLARSAAGRVSGGWLWDCHFYLHRCALAGADGAVGEFAWVLIKVGIEIDGWLFNRTADGNIWI